MKKLTIVCMITLVVLAAGRHLRFPGSIRLVRPYNYGHWDV